MTDNHSGDYVPQHGATAPSGGRRSRRRSRPLLVISILVGVLVVLGVTGGTLFATGVLQTWINPGPADYEGTGEGSVSFTISEGDTGDVIAVNLYKAEVVASSKAFYNLLLETSPEPTFMPGVYTLKKHMSSAAALAALLDPKNLEIDTVVIPEGKTEAQILSIVSEATGLTIDDLQSAASNPLSYGVPAEAPSLEGFLFPATYQFSPGTSARDILQTMVDRCFEALDGSGVAAEDRFRVITLASLVQKEAGVTEDFPKVARVFLNRMDPDQWPTALLESDATVAYGAGVVGKVETTPEQRADESNPYNTYVHPGMLYAPISNPGQVAIDAVLSPAEGPWLYFVCVNYETGETIFSTTADEHAAAVEQWGQWLREHPEYDE